MLNLEKVKSEVISIAHIAGDFLRTERDKIKSSDISEKGRGDFVSHADFQSESILTEELSKIVPESVILAEEEHFDKVEGEYRWIVDPLDGTTNYLQGLPVYAVSIALEKCQPGSEWGELILGVVHLPELNRTWHAAKGSGCYRDKTQVSVKSPQKIEKAVLATGFPLKNRHLTEDFMKLTGNIFNQVANLRRVGSAATDLAWVADGTYHGYWEIGLHPWDAAAGAVLIQEAGGIITDMWGNHVLATGCPITGTQEVYDFLKNEIHKFFPVPPRRNT